MRSRGVAWLAGALLLGGVLGACKTDDGAGLVDRGSCDTLIACASDLAPDSRDEFVATYGEGGNCWDGGPSQWAACRDACRSSLDALNQVGMITGETCGTCSADGDCQGLLGPAAVCDGGVCVGGELGGGGGSEGDESGGSGCTATTEVPDECLRWVGCVAALTPAEAAAAEAEYGAEGSCWCGTEAEASACYQDCLAGLSAANDSDPTESACHASSCSLAELDPSEPYGPVVDGACPDWNDEPQVPVVDPFGLSGSYCAPACSGLANFCPDHAQSTAGGTCYLVVGETELCVSRCYVDPNHLGGNQCPCGATCKPYGSPDGEGHARGLCLFD